MVVDPSDYEGVLAELDEDDGISENTAQELALKAFRKTAEYDAAIAEWLSGEGASAEDVSCA